MEERITDCCVRSESFPEAMGFERNSTQMVETWELHFIARPPFEVLEVR